MATETPPSTAATTITTTPTPTHIEKRSLSIFDVPASFFDGCRLISPSSTPLLDSAPTSLPHQTPLPNNAEDRNGAGSVRWTCHTCKSEFDSLEDQRSHFKSDFHRINVKLSMAGKDVIKEEDFDELALDSFDVSSISGSEDDAEKPSSLRRTDPRRVLEESNKQRIFIRLKTGERISLWKCLLLNEGESIAYNENEKVENYVEDQRDCNSQSLSENEVIERLRLLINEERNGSRSRIVLLAAGGHFAGCVFDGNSVVVHKTFHRYVVRAKAGKKQSLKDASGRAAHSAGASLRRHNELGLKKDIQELLAAWKPYFGTCSSIFIRAPSSNRQLLFDGDKAYFYNEGSAIQNVPLNVRRPTFKEARRVYNQLTQILFEVDGEEMTQQAKEDLVLNVTSIANGSTVSVQEQFKEKFKLVESNDASSSNKLTDESLRLSESDSEIVGTTTPLHEAAKSGNALKVLELLEQGLDPCTKDERGRTPYMLANEKEVRNTFRRFMASNPDKWDWNAGKVPSALTKEMEESQAAKQAEKDAKRKARTKELKKLRKAQEKKAETASCSNAVSVAENRVALPSVIKGSSLPSGRSQLSKEEELKRTMAIEREKRAAAAEKRVAAAAALNAQNSGLATQPTPQKSGSTSDMVCSCCNVSLAGKIPFHRYTYKYCSTSCMFVHKEIMEDGCRT